MKNESLLRAWELVVSLVCWLLKLEFQLDLFESPQILQANNLPLIDLAHQLQVKPINNLSRMDIGAELG